MTSKPPAHDTFLTTDEVLEYLQVNLRKPFRDHQVLEAAARAPGVPAA